MSNRRHAATFIDQNFVWRAPAQRVVARAARAYAVSYARQPAAAGARGYLVQHQSLPMLFGPDGKPIALVPVDAGAAAVADMLAAWVA